MTLISLHNEVKLLSDLVSDTLILIHHTEVVSAIKRLVSAHDILDLTLRLEREYEEFRCQPPWSKATAHDLDHIRCELIARYGDAFKPPVLLPRYYSKMGRLISTMDLRTERSL